MSRPRPSWLYLTRALQVAASPGSLFLAVLGLWGMQLGWIAWDSVSQHTTRYQLAEQHALSSVKPVAQWLEDLGVDRAELPLDPTFGVAACLLRPAARLLSTESFWTGLCGGLLGLLWHTVVWSVFGLAIARKAVLVCGAERTLGCREALRFGLRKWPNAVGAPFAVLVAVLLVGIPVYALSWCIRFDLGVMLIGLLWLLILAFTALATVLGMGLVFGWPLFWGAIATEDSDLFDAVSRAYAYTLQRPGHYLFYVAQAAVLGTLGWGLACVFSEVVVHLAYWSVQVGGGVERTDLLRSAVEHPASPVSLEAGQMVTWGATLVRWANLVPWLLANAFSFAFFWSATSVIYLLLRFDTDQTAIDDIVDRPQAA